MKVKDGFMVRQLGSQYVVVALGSAMDEFKGMIRVNEAGAYLWKQLSAGDVTEDALVAAMLSEYEVDEATARKDVEGFLASLEQAGLLVG